MSLRGAIARWALGLALAGALAPGLAIAASGPPPPRCGGTGSTSMYCIPLRGVFAFTGTRTGRGCSLVVRYDLEPKVEGLRGRVRLTVTGLDPGNRRVRVVARPLVTGGHLSYTFRSLRGGRYELTGRYQGDTVRSPSAVKRRRLRMRCRR